MATGDDLTLGGGHTMQFIDHVSQRRALANYVTLSTNVTPINLM